VYVEAWLGFVKAACLQVTQAVMFRQETAF